MLILVAQIGIPIKRIGKLIIIQAILILSAINMKILQ